MYSWVNKGCVCGGDELGFLSFFTKLKNRVGKEEKNKTGSRITPIN